MIGVILTYFVGCLAGLAVAPFYGPGGFSADWATTQLESFKMMSRGTPYSFIGGAFTAAPSGIGVALGITGTNNLSCSLYLSVSLSLFSFA
jgi:hypothetical protein